MAFSAIGFRNGLSSAHHALANDLRRLGFLLTALHGESLTLGQRHHLGSATERLSRLEYETRQSSWSIPVFARQAMQVIWHLRRLLESLSGRGDPLSFVLTSVIRELFDLANEAVE